MGQIRIWNLELLLRKLYDHKYQPASGKSKNMFSGSGATTEKNEAFLVEDLNFRANQADLVDSTFMTRLTVEESASYAYEKKNISERYNCREIMKGTQGPDFTHLSCRKTHFDNFKFI